MTKLNEIPTCEELTDKIMTYHQQKLMDLHYRRKPRQIQCNILSEWLVLSPFIIKGNIKDYDEKELLNRLSYCFTLIEKQILNTL